MYATVRNGSIEVFKKSKPIQYNGITYPSSIFRLWSDEELKAIGVYRVKRASWDKKFYTASLSYEFNDLENQVVEVATTTLLPLDTIKEKHKRRNRGCFQAQTNIGFTYNDVVFEIDLVSQSRMAHARLRALDETIEHPLDFAWRAMDDTFVPMDRAGVLAFTAAASDHVYSLMKKKWTVEAEIDALTEANVVEFDVESRWSE